MTSVYTERAADRGSAARTVHVNRFGREPKRVGGSSASEPHHQGLPDLVGLGGARPTLRIAHRYLACASAAAQ